MCIAVILYQNIPISPLIYSILHLTHVKVGNVVDQSLRWRTFLGWQLTLVWFMLRTDDVNKGCLGQIAALLQKNVFFSN